jgi:hypothetical protein
MNLCRLHFTDVKVAKVSTPAKVYKNAYIFTYLMNWHYHYAAFQIKINYRHISFIYLFSAIDISNTRST